MAMLNNQMVDPFYWCLLGNGADYWDDFFGEMDHSRKFPA
jgi:hypothetical protein